MDPDTLAQRLRRRDVTVIDIREHDEFVREHIPGALSVPLSTLDKSGLSLEAHGDVVFHCKSGMRTNANCNRLADHIDGPAFVLTGGLEAWKLSGGATAKDAAAPLELNRQVQITVGALMLISVMLTIFVAPQFLALPALLGAGLLMAGLTGWCGMAHLLAAMPWNRRR
jgi:rhodanese-related sulfurtransferase